MRCDFEYCVFNENFECYFDEVIINSLGMCEECIIFSLPKAKLTQYKKEQLNKIIERYENDCE